MQLAKILEAIEAARPRIQAEAAVRLLENDAAVARKIVADYKPVCPTIADYVRLADSIDFDKEVVAYGEDGRITISFDR